MSKKFEQLLEYVVNNETEKAQALFHDIVVGKSREIYENLIASEADEMSEDGIGGPEVESLLDEISADEGEMHEAEEDMPVMGDEEHADMGDEHMGDEHMGGEETMGGEEHGAEDMEDRLVDLEDALSQLKAEFDDLMSHEADEEEHGDEVGDEEADEEEADEMDAEEDSEEDSEEDAEEDSEEDLDESMEEEEEDEEEDLDEDVVLEYTEKVGETYKSGKGVSNKSEDSGTNKVSPIAKKPRSTSIGGEPIQVKNGGEGNHSHDGKAVKKPGKLTDATTKGAGTKMSKVQDMKKA